MFSKLFSCIFMHWKLFVNSCRKSICELFQRRCRKNIQINSTFLVLQMKKTCLTSAVFPILRCENTAVLLLFSIFFSNIHHSINCAKCAISPKMTLPKLLKKKGYHTGIVDKWMIKPEKNYTFSIASNCILFPFCRSSAK